MNQTASDGSNRSANASIDLSTMPPGIHPIRVTSIVCYLLEDDNGCALIDTGLIGEVGAIRRKMKKLGRPMTDIKWILLTHGHLDHAGNLHQLKKETGATVYGHPLEQQHINGEFPYSGIARFCGWLEAMGQFVLRYKPVAIDETFDDGDVLPCFGGLKVMHLPGHTVGHCGFYCERLGILFTGDLFVSGLYGTQGPPRIFSSCMELLPGSWKRVKELDPPGILPNHFRVFTPAEGRVRFDKLCSIKGL